MARIRTIKPDFWDDEALGKLPIEARLLFICTWNLADDCANLRGSERYLRLRAFPYDDYTDEDVRGWRDALIAGGQLFLYLNRDQAYLHIVNFHEHQRINRPSVAGKVPGPEDPESKDFKGLRGELTEYSLRAHGGLTEGSPQEGNGKEGKGKERIPPNPPGGDYSHSYPQNNPQRGKKRGRSRPQKFNQKMVGAHLPRKGESDG